MYVYICIYIYTGLFINPFGISDPCGAAAGMVTPKGSMSTEGETLFKFLSYLTGARYVHSW
jgi:hypothetical protein